MQEKDAIVKKMQQIVGYVPIGTLDLLSIIAHPDVIELTKAYLDKMDIDGRCKLYEYPWNCAKDAEARYQTIAVGDLKGPGVSLSGVGFDESWCEPCRKKVLEGG